MGVVGLAENKATQPRLIGIGLSLAIFVSIWLPFRLLQGGCWARNKLSRAGGWVAGWGGIGNKAQLRPAKAGAGTWPELGKNVLAIPFCSQFAY